ncbi:MAG: murB [Chloroflexi bacterium]|nr:murB [Chloroflexota bacterium]
MRVKTSAVSSIRALAERLGPAARCDAPLARYTSIRVGGTADLFLVAKSRDQLVEAVERAAELEIPWRVIGSASNLLVSDEGVDGLIIKVGVGTTSIETSNDESGALLRADAGCILAAVAKQAAKQGYGGLEWAANVPGTVGAAVVNNSGAFGSCTSEQLASAGVFTPGHGVATLSAADLDMHYRSTRLKRNELRGVVLDAAFRVTPGDPIALAQRIREIQGRRRATQPTGFSVGSVFANPSGDTAGRLIETCGLKARRRGDAEVSQLHANFIVNRGSARARDVLDLMMEVQRTVWERAGHWLSPELQLVGRWTAEDLVVLSRPPGAAQ